MKKVLLVTLYGESNFGNRLQNYALQTILSSMNCAVDNLIVNNLAQKSSSDAAKQFVKKALVLFGMNKYKAVVAVGMRTDKFLIFRKKYFYNNIYCTRDEVDSSDWGKYDFGITGSDQVWHNWGTIKNELDYYYLSFIEPQKRISYAPSFGFTKFPQEDIEAHRNGLMGMRALSCREKEGCEMIQDLTGLEAQSVLDPTLLLTRDQWINIERKPRFCTRKKYLLTFFLGNIPDDYQEEIKRIRVEKHLVEININNPSDPNHYAISPDEFIWLIHHASMVCTDSFHCSVFSIIFERGLRVFERTGKHTDMFGRLRDLLELFGLIELAYGYGDGSKYSTELTYETLERFRQEKEKSISYLRNAICAKT